MPRLSGAERGERAGRAGEEGLSAGARRSDSATGGEAYFALSME
jgi:hypothetical protein